MPVTHPPKPFYEHPVAELYALSTLDFVMEMASAVAKDFFQRSQAYSNVSDATAQKLIAFRSFLGSHPDWPSLQQRASIYRVLSQGNQLCSYSVGLRLAALNYSRRSSAENSPFAASVLDSAEAFQAYVRKHDGQPLRSGARQIRTLFRSSVAVLTDPALALVFRVKPPEAARWPFDAGLDTGGACLLENINDTIITKRKGRLSASLVFAKQRIAHYGARCMTQVLDDGHEIPEQKRFSQLVEDCNRWAQGLRELVPHVIRYWRDPDAASAADAVEQQQVPANPAGAIDLQGLITPTADTGQTCTGGAICCCDSMDYCATNFDDCIGADVTTVDLEDGSHVDDWCDA